MEEKSSKKYPSTFTIDNFSSTTVLTPHEMKLDLGSKHSIDEKPYNPMDHRQVEHPNAFSGALIHILKSSLGTGILAIPLAFKNAGLVVGFIGTILVGILCTHTIHILVSASQRLCRISKVPSLGFSETAEAAVKFGPKGIRNWSNFAKIFVDVALILTYFFGCAVYTVFISDSVSQIVVHYHPETDSYKKEYYMLALLLPLIIFCQIRPLKFLVPFSAIANVTMVIAFGITFYYMTVKVKDVKVDDRSLAAGIEGLPRFFSTVIFAMEGVGAIMPVENSMIKGKFIGCPSVLNVAMTIVVSMYAAIGFFGYFVYGEDTKPSVTYNLPEELVSQIGKGCISIAVFFTYMLQFYIPMDITWRKLESHIAQKWHNMAQIGIRTGTVILITGVAAAVPDLGTIIDLVGSIFFSTLGLFIPAVVDTIVNWENGLGRYKWRLYKNILICCFSLFALFSGSYYAIADLFK